MLNPIFAIVGGLTNGLGDIYYLICALRGKVKPNKVTWFLWALAPLIIFVSQVKQGVGIQSFMSFVAGFVPSLIFIASFLNKKAYWKITRFDLTCGLFSLLGLLLWYLTGVGNLAIFFSIVADGIAAIPTIVKAYYFPETETPVVFIFNGAGSILTLLTIKDWNFATYGFSLYLLCLCIVMVTLIKFNPQKNSR